MEWATSKIIPIKGDLMVEGLDISHEDREVIVNEVEIFINSAASVNFDDPLKQALNINYFGTCRMLELAMQCKKLKVFTHISTAYVNCTRGNFDEIEEEIYFDN